MTPGNHGRSVLTERLRRQREHHPEGRPGARHVLREEGRRIPDDVALVGFDDSAVARHMDPALTSVRQPIEEMGRTMVRVLLQEIAGRTGDRPAIMLPTQLVVRDSS